LDLFYQSKRDKLGRDMLIVRLIIPVFFFSFVTNLLSQEKDNYLDNVEVIEFIEFMQKEHSFQKKELLELFSTAKFQEKVIRIMNRQPEGTMTWHQYKEMMVTKERANSGETFINSYREDLKRAEDIYGVPAEVIASIIGIETRYGMITGNIRVLDSLVTLSFNYPRREKFFRKQLEEFLLLGREENLDLKKIKGSIAGAMGYGQFMPDSYRKYAVDFDFDGRKDILNNPLDAIGSVANFLSKKGKWEPNTEIVLKAKVLENRSPIVKSSFKPHMTVRELRKIGLEPLSRLSGNTLVVPIELEGEEGKEYWLGLKNYHALSRYNRSKLYIMAVVEFSYLLESSFY